MEEHLDLSVFERRYRGLSKIGDWGQNQDANSPDTVVEIGTLRTFGRSGGETRTLRAAGRWARFA